jgi:outer membrane protein
MNWKVLFVPLVFFGMSNISKGQTAWSLKQCIDHALQNNIQIKQSSLSVESAEATYQMTKAGTLPSVNAYASHGYNLGQSIDPFTNQFANSTVQTNSFSVSSSVTLFSGLTTWQNIQRTRLDNEASKFDVEQMKNDVSLTVATTYLSVLFNQELAENARGQVEVSRQQVERIEKLVKAGQLAKGNLLDMEAQLANDELTLVNNENALAISYLNLSQVMMLSPEQSATFEIQRPQLPDLGSASIATNPDEVYNAALNTMPEVKSGELRILSSDRSLKASQGGRYPRLSASMSYGTGYSGAAQSFQGLSSNGGFDTIGFNAFTFDPVVSPTFSASYIDKPFSDQVKDNVNTQISFTLSIPIFNGLSVNNSVQQAKISRINADLNLESTKNTMRVNIEQAYADAVAALKRYRASEKSVSSLEESFKYSRIRYEEKMINSVEFNDAKNKLALAQSNLVQAKYDFIFKTKILDFYQGKPLSL